METTTPESRRDLKAANTWRPVLNALYRFMDDYPMPQLPRRPETGDRYTYEENDTTEKGTVLDVINGILICLPDGACRTCRYRMLDPRLTTAPATTQNPQKETE